MIVSTLEKNWDDKCGSPIGVYFALRSVNWQYLNSSWCLLSIVLAMSQKVLTEMAYML